MLVFGQNRAAKAGGGIADEEAFQRGIDDSSADASIGGVPVAEVIRKPGISEQTFYRWKAKYAGLEVDQVRQMAQLQEENLAMPPSQAANLR